MYHRKFPSQPLVEIPCALKAAVNSPPQWMLNAEFGQFAMQQRKQSLAGEIQLVEFDFGEPSQSTLPCVFSEPRIARMSSTCCGVAKKLGVCMEALCSRFLVGSPIVQAPSFQNQNLVGKFGESAVMSD